MAKQKQTRSPWGPFTLGGLAAAAAVSRQPGSGWRTPLTLAAGMGFVTGAVRLAAPRISAAGQGAPERVRSAVINGIRMRWEAHGEASDAAIPVVLVHGLPTNPRVWRHVIPHLRRKGAYCLAWEQVGMGWSLKEGLDRDISMAKQAEYLYQWLQHLGIERAYFIAHHFGGGVVQHLLVKHPEVCQGVVLSDSVAYANWPVPAAKAARKLRHVIARMPPSLVRPFFQSTLANLGHDNLRRSAEAAILYWEPYADRFGPRGLAHQLKYLRARDTIDIANDLPNVDVPTRIVWGEKDPLGLTSARRLASELRAPLRIVSGGKHFTPEDHPDVIAEEFDMLFADTAYGQPIDTGSSEERRPTH